MLCSTKYNVVTETSRKIIVNGTVSRDGSVKGKQTRIVASGGIRIIIQGASLQFS